MTHREVVALLTFGLVAVGALSVRAVKLSGGRRRAIKADAHEARLREAEAFAQVAPSQAPGQAKPKRGPDPREYAAPWMDALKKALNHGGTQRAKRDRSESKRKQVQLATVDPATGRPAVRTIVFRGFLASELANGDGAAPKPKNGESCLLTFITDSRAEKVRHVSTSPSGRAPVELCWWLDEAGVQYRISGDAVLASASSDDPQLRAACEAVWERLGEGTRRTFTWPHPGEQVAEGDGARPKGDGVSEGTGAQREGDGVSLSKANFRLLVVVPHRVDELRLGGKQTRTLFTLSEAPGAAGEGPLALRGTEWRVDDVNP